MNFQKDHNSTINKKHHLNIVVLAEDIRTPENLGMIMRLSDAFGVKEVIFVGDKTTEISTKAKRAARNTFNTLTYQHIADVNHSVKKLKEEGYKLVALEITSKSKPIELFPFSANEKVALIIGSERQGISKELLDMVDEAYHINMFGENSSINVANALSIALYQLVNSMLDKS